MNKVTLSLSKIGKINENLIREEQLNKITSFKSLKRQKESLSAYQLLSLMLKDINVTNYKINYNKYHKPYLNNEEVFFNISHSEKYVLVGLASVLIGIDIEKIDKRVLKIEKKFMNEEIKSSNKEDELTKLWTLKEAFIKSFDDGATFEFKKIIILKDNQIYNLSYEGNKRVCKVIKFEDYYISVCLNEEDEFLIDFKDRVL